MRGNSVLREVQRWLAIAPVSKSKPSALAARGRS